MARIPTFHQIIAGCENGQAEAWRWFIIQYTPVAFRVIDVYLDPGGGRGVRREVFWRDVLGALAADDCQRLRGFEHQAEREFLIDLRRFLLEQGCAALDPAWDDSRAEPPTSERLKALLAGVPLLQQEIVFFKLAGYSDATIEKLLRISPGVARQGIERLQADYSIALSRQIDRSIWPSGWMKVLRQAWASRSEGCAPVRQFIRIQDGQTTWYEKEPTEHHIVQCLSCLEAWTALREVGLFRREASGLPAPEVEALLSGLKIPAPAPRRKPWFRRAFG